MWRESFLRTDANGNINVRETALAHLSVSSPLVGVVGVSTSVRVLWEPANSAVLPIKLPLSWLGCGPGFYELGRLPLRWAAFPLGWWDIEVPLVAFWQTISRDETGESYSQWRTEIMPGSLLAATSGDGTTDALWGSSPLDLLLPQVRQGVGSGQPAL